MSWLFYLGYIFILYSFGGWCLEEVYCYVIKHHFKEDKFLMAPFKPMYGVAIGILVYLYSILRIRGVLLIISVLVIPTLIEGISGFLLRSIFHKDYWDYSDMKCNYKGVVCLRFSAYWPLLAVFVLAVLQPIVNYIYRKGTVIINIIVPIIIAYIILDLILTTVKLKSSQLGARIKLMDNKKRRI